MDSEPQDKEIPRVTEEAILDSLFYACDEKGTGFVAVSKLIEYLRSAIASDSDNNNVEFVDNLDDLSLILDPDGQDVHIDISTYQAGISEWIEDIRKRSLASIDDDFLSSVSINCTSPPFGPQSEGHNHITSTPNVSSNSVEGVGGESPIKNDSDRAAEMISIIETLQLNNKRLLEQHAIIQAQMEQTEETNAQLHAEVQELKKQIESYQALAVKCKELETENIDLRQSVAESKEISTNLQNANTLLLKEKKNLESSIEQLQSKLISSQHHLEALQDERRALSESLTIQKEVNMRLEEIHHAKEDLVQESSSKTEYLTSVIHELSLANEDLKTEKTKLAEALSDLNGELARLRKQHSPILPLHLQIPNKTSTPTRKHFSLKQELEEQLTSDNKNLPSPLVGNSFRLEGSNNSDVSNLSSLDQSWNSYVSCDSNNSIESYSIIASQVANEFKDKKERALRQIEELDKLEKTPEIKQKQLQLKAQFDKDLDTFAEKVNLLSMKKKNAEKRSAKLLVAMKQLKEESKQLQDERDKAYQKLGNLSLNTDQLDSRVTELQNALANERMKSKDVEEKLKTLERQLISANSELTRVRSDKDTLQQSLHTHIEGKQSLEKILEEVNRSHSELDIQQAHQQLRIKELENELARATSNLALERERVAALEESLQLSVNKNNSEMQEILDMIPFVDANRSSPKTSSPRATGHTVRLKLKDFLSRIDYEPLANNTVRAPPDGTPITQREAVMVEGKTITRSSSPPPSPKTTGRSSPSPPVSPKIPGRSPSPPPLTIGRSSPSPPVSPKTTGRSSPSPLVTRETRTTGSQTDLTDLSDEPKLISLWRRKLSPGATPLDDDLVFDSIDPSLNSSHFVDGVGLHVRPPPNEKEIEKQFKTLVLAFQTDQLTLKKRLDVQTRSREIAEKNMDRELQNLSTQMKNLEEKYMKTKELQQVSSSMKSQVEVLRRSAQRLGIVAQQHGSVQQESRMWSGIEVMICHAENLKRQVERMKLDLNEFRNKDQLHSEDSDSSETRPNATLNGPIRLGGCGEEDKSRKDQNTNEENSSSLASFVMAIHNTSQRAHQVIQNFRRRTIDASTLHSSFENSKQESVDTAVEGDHGDRDSEVSGTSGNITEDEENVVYITEEQQGEQEPSQCSRICWRFLRYTGFFILVIALSLFIILFLNHNTSYKLQRDHIPKPLLEILDPIATLVHHRRPPS